MEHPSITSSIEEAASAALFGLVPEDTGAQPAPPAKQPEPTNEEPLEQDETVEPEKDEGDTELGQKKAPLPESITLKPIADALKSEFVAYDSDGKPVEAIPDLVIEYKANGKVRKDRIDQVVKMAQLGVYNREREEQYISQAEEVENVANEVIGRLETRERQLRNLLEDPDAYENARAIYLQENAPEKRAARAEQEAAQVKASVAEQRAAAEGAQFYQSNVLPRLDDILTQYPEVEADELIAQFTMAVQPLVKNGRIPRERYGAVVSFVESELADWARSKHERRIAKVAPANKAAEQARIDAAKAKRQQAAASAPARGAASRPAQPAPKKEIITVADAESDALNEALAGFIPRN